MNELSAALVIFFLTVVTIIIFGIMAGLVRRSTNSYEDPRTRTGNTEMIH